MARIQCGVQAARIYRKTGNLHAVQLLLGHTKLSTVRCLGIEVDDALSVAETISAFWSPISSSPEKIVGLAGKIVIRWPSSPSSTRSGL
jgi:hypothetical protein